VAPSGRLELSPLLSVRTKDGSASFYRGSLTALLAPYPSEDMICCPVSARGGNVKNNDPIRASSSPSQRHESRRLRLLGIFEDDWEVHLKVYYDAARTYPTARLHPYTEYVDFVQHLDQIPVALEDFRPFSDRTAIQTFYDFLRWLNGPDSHFQSCDCVLRPPSSRPTWRMWKKPPNPPTPSSPPSSAGDKR
jgi:hypothetical protein